MQITCASSLHPRRSARRGVALMLVMIAVIVAGTLAVSYVSTQSTALAVARNIRNHAQARYIAESGADAALAAIRTNPAWRSTFSHGVWASNLPLAGGSYTVAGYDGLDTNADGTIDGDGNLADDPADPVTLLITGRYGGMTHIVRLGITPNAAVGGALYVVGNPNSLTTIESGRKQLLETLYGGVVLADDNDSADALEEAAGSAGVILVSDSATGLGNKLRACRTGVVLECGALSNGFGFSSTSAGFTAPNGGIIKVVNSKHSVTKILGNGASTLGPGNIEMVHPSGTFAPGFVALGERVSSASTKLIAVIDSGQSLYGGGASGARRVFLPTGRFSSTQLTNDGLEVLKAALAWAAESSSSGASGSGQGSTYTIDHNSIDWLN